MARQQSTKVDISGSFDTASALNTATASLRYWWDIQPKKNGPFRSRWRRQQFGNIILAESECEPCVARRGFGERQIQNEQFICIAAMIDGQMDASQNKKSLHIEPGDVHVFDAHSPIEMNLSRTIHTRGIWIKKSSIDMLCVSKIQNFFETVNVGNPVRKILFSQLLELHEFAHLLDASQLSRITNSIIESFLCCIESSNVTEYSQCTIYDRVMGHIKERLDDEDLSVDTVSSDIGVGIRTIRRACFENKTTFTAMLRDQRLHQAARLISLPNAKAMSLTEVAHRFAFYDLAHFSRSFKIRFGCSPSDYRKVIN